MSKLYLVRHGQADRLSKNYDQLTELGRNQAKKLGQYFHSMGIEFDACITGTLVRQKQTAQEILTELKSKGNCTPNLISEDENWNEFESRLWLTIASKIRETDSSFSDLYERFKELQEGQNPEARVVFQKVIHRVIKEWTEEKWGEIPPYTFKQYCSRIRTAFGNLMPANSTLVVSSATPVAITIGLSIQCPENEMLPYMKNIHNTSLSVYEKQGDKLVLVSFNSLPHLQERELITIG